uniref:hypothetical protein n=1 Tax=Acetatifactor sp. TaxID=1872090 RepID=UPI0040567B5B
MGGVFELKCPRCRYKSVWELWIAHGYRKEHDTTEEIKNGLWGMELQKLIENEEVIINQDEVMFACDVCRAIDVRPSLAYKTQLRKINYREVIDDANAFQEAIKKHMKDDYTNWVKYHHICKNCDIQMREIFNPVEEGPILCPRCEEVLIAKFSGVS